MRQPTAEHKTELEARFDEVFSQKTRFTTLTQRLARISNNEAELLLLLERPDIPLHTTGSASDIRDTVKKNKVNGGTRSDQGQRCRDTFGSLKETCRKLRISFCVYLIDRVSRTNAIPPLPQIIEHRAASP